MHPSLGESSDKSSTIARVVSALIDDYQRRGGYLSGDHVLRAIEKRGLDQEDDVLVRQQLHSQGIEIDDPESLVDFDRLDQSSERSEDLVRRYLHEIGSIRLLQPQEEIVLGRRIQAGKSAAKALGEGISDENTALELKKRVLEGQEAEHHMINANLRLVVSIARAYALRTNLHLLDLIQEGTLGLFKAVSKFDHTKGFKFSTYDLPSLMWTS